MKQDSIKNYEFIRVPEDDDLSIARALFTEYAQSLNFDLCFQDFENELKELDVMYQKPGGGLILIKEMNTGGFVGCVGIRKSEHQIAELKRMYIKEAHRKKGLGAKLLDCAVILAKDLNYEKIRLDTIDSMKSAIKLYRDKGFREIKPYRFNPNENALFFELTL
ncbi:MAG: GNAT family N-acetyltransferase [Bacteroidetes bacterium]|nr:GNAT family N-acetyltransferase [Bacteroidota bacterium]